MVSKINFVYRPILTKDRLPKEPGDYFTSDGILNKSSEFRGWRYYHPIDLEYIKVSAPEWWLEKIELPTKEELENISNQYFLELAEKARQARNFKGQVAGRHPDNITKQEMFAQKLGFDNGIEWIINKIKGG